MEIDTEKLIGLIENRQPIYNYTLKEHHNKYFVDKLWEEVAKEMNATVTDCKSKWNVLRSCYARHLRKIKKLPSGSAASKKKKWYLADSMSFLNAFIGQHRKSTGNAITENIIEDDIRSPEDSGNDASLVEDISLDITVPSPANPHHTHVKKIRMTPVDLVAGPMIELLKSQTDQWPEPVRPIMKFFESLVPDVEKLSSRRQRLFKERVLHILHNYLDEEENEAPLNSRCSTCSSSSPQPILM